MLKVLGNCLQLTELKGLINLNDLDHQSNNSTENVTDLAASESNTSATHTEVDAMDHCHQAASDAPCLAVL